MKNAVPTNHSMRRGNQRLGLSKNETKKMASRALQYGLDKKDTKGKLLDEMNTCSGHIKYYAGGIYIFNDRNVLITVVKVDPSIEPNLIDYVSYPTFVRYKKNKHQFMSTREEINDILMESRQRLIQKLNNTYFKNTTVKAQYVEITSNGITIRVNTRDIEKIKYWQDGFKKLYGMNLDTEGDLKKIVTNWFGYYQGLRVRTIYEDTCSVVIQVPNTKGIFPGVKKRFENEFKRELIVEKVAPESFDPVPRKDNIIQNQHSAELINWFKTQCGIDIVVYSIDPFMVSIKAEQPITEEMINKFNKKFGKMLDIR